MIRRALLPLAILLALGLVAVDTAEAAPLPAPAPGPSVAFGGVHVGVGVAIPLGPRRARRHHHVAPRGRWVVEQHRVWVPGEVVGYDRFGHPIVTEGFWTVERQRVWVPYRRHVVHPAPRRPRGHVAVGLHFH